jgi:acyl-coenzyme A synthetase/AMP-(fatty) acid ligase
VWREATGLTIHDGYGQTETVNLVANYRCLPVREGSMGKPTPGFDVRIVDDDGIPLGPGETGHIGVRVKPERPVGLFREYWRDEDATRNSVRGEFYDTGDTAYTDDEGYLWFVGRADDVITSSAYRIGPFEVESALVEHRAVAEAAVVGKPDPLRGEIVKAFIALKSGYEPSDELAKDIQDFVKRITAPYKYPREIEFVDELPKTVSGKIRRVELRQREIDRAAEQP